MRRLVVVLVIGPGCFVGDPDDGDRAMLDQVSHYDSMERVNARPLASQLGAFQIDTYVTGDTTDYRRIHPESDGSNVRVAPGTLIVRAVLGPDGRPAKLTVMGKHEPGYDPTLGDWWFAVTSPLGIPLVEDGVLQAGRLSGCHDCHRERARDDYLFGVRAGDQR